VCRLHTWRTGEGDIRLSTDDGPASSSFVMDDDDDDAEVLNEAELTSRTSSSPQPPRLDHVDDEATTAWASAGDRDA
jgi:hypothetical protein